MNRQLLSLNNNLSLPSILRVILNRMSVNNHKPRKLYIPPQSREITGQQDSIHRTTKKSNPDLGVSLAQVPKTDNLQILAKLLNKFVDKILGDADSYFTGHTTQEALNFVLDETTNENEKEILKRNFTKENDGKITANQEFISKLDQILEKRMHEEYSKTGVFSPVFHNIDTKAYANSQDRQTFWPNHLPAEMDYT